MPGPGLCEAWSLVLSLVVLLPGGIRVGQAAFMMDENGRQPPLEVYNDGTRRLQQGKLRDAEMYLQSAVASNDESLQPVALYNLAHVRFRMGVEALKDSADAQAVAARGQRASDAGDEAIRKADAALAGDSLDAIIQAYLHGRGTRKQLKAATEAVKRAMESYGSVLLRWQRASGDFKSAHELRPSDQEAKANAETVDRHIAMLVDREEMLRLAMECAGGKRQELRDRMRQLKKRMPEAMQAQLEGDEDDDEEEGEDPKEPKKGQEKESREGREMAMTWEDAARLLEALKLDANRKLPMGVEQTEDSKKRAGRDW